MSSLPNIRPKVICVCFNPLVNPNESQSNDDVDAIWANPPPAHALDVAELLSQLDIDVTLTGFLPKGCINKQEQYCLQEKFTTQFIEINNFSSNESSPYSTNPFVVTDVEKEQFIALMIRFVEQQVHSVLFTGDLPYNFNLQDFKVLIKRLRKRNSELFIEMNEKVLGIVGTCVSITDQHLDTQHRYKRMAWLQDNRLEILFDNRISDSYDRFEIAFASFEKRNPRHIRSAIFAYLIFVTANALMHNNTFHKKIQMAFTKVFQMMNSANCEYQKRESLDLRTMQLLNVSSPENIVSDEDIVKGLAIQIIHAVHQDHLILATALDISSYQDYFSIKNLDN